MLKYMLLIVMASVSLAIAQDDDNEVDGKEVKAKEIVYEQPTEWSVYPADEPVRRCPDIRKARLQLKYEPRISLEEGLRRFLTWSDGVYTGQD